MCYIVSTAECVTYSIAAETQRLPFTSLTAGGENIDFKNICILPSRITVCLFYMFDIRALPISVHYIPTSALITLNVRKYNVTLSNLLKI
jgi:hypothetical protein